MSESIYELLPRVAEDVGVVGKERSNEQQNYKFRGIDDVMTAVHYALVKHHVSVVPCVLSNTYEIRERKMSNGQMGVTIYAVLKVRYSFIAPDGSHIDAVVVGEGADVADKAHNKAMSAAFKYALTQTLCIPFTQQEDADATTPDMGFSAEQQAAAALHERRDRVFEALKQLPEWARTPLKAWAADAKIGLTYAALLNAAALDRVEEALVEYGSTDEKAVETPAIPAQDGPGSTQGSESADDSVATAPPVPDPSEIVLTPEGAAAAISEGRTTIGDIVESHPELAAAADRAEQAGIEARNRQNARTAAAKK